MSKKSELYQWAMIAVVQSESLGAVTKIEVVEQLLIDRKVAVFNEEALKPLPEEDEL